MRSGNCPAHLVEPMKKNPVQNCHSIDHIIIEIELNQPRHRKQQPVPKPAKNLSRRPCRTRAFQNSKQPPVVGFQRALRYGKRLRSLEAHDTRQVKYGGSWELEVWCARVLKSRHGILQEITREKEAVNEFWSAISSGI
ncbi:hypothetical protein JTB14_028041 [Gonioctena quinquepunctata]|nr:hypothetical protein JTB14_028041 [Gonioctena quinquepunctata]